MYGQGRCNLARHRDYCDKERGHAVCGFNPEGESDDTVIAGRITDAAGQTMATVVDCAVRRALAWDNTLLSPDSIGAMRETVEQHAGGICLFLQGESGDLGPREGFVGDTAVADRNGRQLGFAVLWLWKTCRLPEQNMLRRASTVGNTRIRRVEACAVFRRRVAFAGRLVLGDNDFATAVSSRSADGG